MELFTRLKVLLLLSLLCVAGLAERASAAAFQPATLYPAGAVHVKELPNGVNVLVRPTPGSGTLSLQVWVEAGSRFESETNNGATHLIEMLALQGSRDYPTETNGELSGPQTQLENLGADVNSYTARDDVFWSVTLAPSALPDAAKILANAVLFPNLDDDSVAAGKTMATGEWISRRMDPLGYSSDLAYAAAFKTHPYRKPVQGSADSFKQLTGHDVRAYHQQRFTGSHIRIVTVGDVEATSATESIARAFGIAPKTTKADVPIAAESPIEEVHQITERGVLPIKVLTYAWRSPKVGDARDAVAADLVLTYLNEGSQAALRLALQGEESNEPEDEEDVDENAAPSPTELAGGFSVDYLTQRDSGLFLIHIVAPIKEEEAISAVMELMERVRNGLSANDLQHAKTTLRHQYVEQAESSAGQAGGLGFYDAIDSYHFAENYLKLIEETTNADIADVAQKYFGEKNYVQVTLLPAVGNPQLNPGGGIIARRPGAGAVDAKVY